MKFSDLFKTTNVVNEVYQETQIFTESNKVMEILLEKEKDIIKGLTPYEELKLVQDALKSAPRNEKLDLFDREEELNKIIRTEDYPMIEIPEEHKDLVKENYEKELAAAEKMERERILRVKAIDQEMETLEAEKKVMLDEIKSIRSNTNYVNLIHTLMNGQKEPIVFKENVFGESKWHPISYHVYRSYTGGHPSKIKFSEVRGKK